MRNDVDYYNLFGLEKPSEEGTGEKEQVSDMSKSEMSVSEPVNESNDIGEGIDIESIDVGTGTSDMNTDDGQASNIDNGELSGIEPENNGQTDTEDLYEGTTEGEKERKSAEPAQINPEDKKKQSDDENAKYAAARRKAEQEKEIALKRAEEEIILQLGVKHPLTLKPVRTVEEYKEYLKASNEVKREQFKTQYNLDDDGYKELIGDIPEVQEAQIVKTQMEVQQEAARQEAVNKLIEEHVREIMKYEPDVKSVDDILSLPEAPVIAEHLKNGMDLLQAYRLTSFDRMARKAEETKKNMQMQTKAEVNKLKSKDHLKKISGNQGDGSPSVPQDVLKLYRKMMPDLNDREIYEHYKSYAKNKEV